MSSKWINCGTLPYGVVSAMIEGETVRISYRNPQEQADGLDEIREAVEAALGVWIETPSMHRWSAAEGDCEIVQTVPLYKFQPTHEIVFTPDGGAAQVTRVCLFSSKVAYTRGEMEADAAATDWEINDHGDWLHGGRATPGGAKGSVKVRRACHGGAVDRVFQVTRKSDDEFFRFACPNADEAFRRSQEAAGLASWTRDSVTIVDIGGTDAEHIRADASTEVQAAIETCCARAREVALEYVRDNDAFKSGAHRKMGVMYGSVMRSLGIDDAMDAICTQATATPPSKRVKDAVKGVWSSSYRWGGDFMEGAVMFVMQRVYDAAWTAFGDEVDRLRAK